jgi:hypothetical protein
MRSFAVALVLSIAAGHAFACDQPAALRSIFHHTIPTNVDADVIAEVTVTRVGNWRADMVSLGLDPAVVSMWLRDWFEDGEARVIRAIKGAIKDGETIKLKVPPNVCQPAGVGESGIVLGNFERDEDGAVRLKLRLDPIFPPAENSR